VNKKRGADRPIVSNAEREGKIKGEYGNADYTGRTHKKAAREKRERKRIKFKRGKKEEAHVGGGKKGGGCGATRKVIGP